jgi:hypothetical protein
MTVSFTGCDLREWFTCAVAQQICYLEDEDPFAPVAIGDLTATAGDGQVTLTWTPSPSADVVQYWVQRSDQQGGSFGQYDFVRTLDDGRASGPVAVSGNGAARAGRPRRMAAECRSLARR